MASNPTTGSAPGTSACADLAAPAPASAERRRPRHVGDIQGAFGTIRQHEEAHRGLRARALALLAIIGPGLIVMVGDNDAGGVATYSQAGQNYGTSLLWVLLLLIPVLIVNQEMVVRLGAVTGVGHARLINERFGRFWGWFSVGDLFAAELPDDRHRVHRRQPRARLLRRLRSTSRSRSRQRRWSRSPPAAASASGSARCSCSCSRTCW